MEDGGGSAQQERILCQNFVDLRRYRRSSMAKSLVAKSTKSESNLEVGLPRTVRQQPTFVFWRETFSSTFSSGAKTSRAFACADQRLMASPLRQTSHSAMYRVFLPFSFLWLLVQFIFTAPLFVLRKQYKDTYNQETKEIDSSKHDDRNCSIQKKDEREREERERERERGRERGGGGGRGRERERERERERDLHQATVKTNNFGMHARQVHSSL